MNWYLISFDIILFILGLIGFVPAMMSMMCFDSPGSENHIWTRLFVFGQITFCISAIILEPIILILVIGFEHQWASYMVPIPLIGLMTAFSGALGIFTFQDGRF